MLARVTKLENTGAMHPIEYVMIALGTIVGILGVAGLVALVRSH